MKKIQTTILIIASLFAVTALASNANASSRSARTYNSRIYKGQLVQLDQVKQLNGKKVFKISRKGKAVKGWIKDAKLKRTTKYVLPAKYTSQLYPLYAPEGCESVALKMALSVKGQNMPLKKFLQALPLTNNPNTGFANGTPFKPAGNNCTIYPKPLLKVAQKKQFNYTNVANITGASKAKLIREIKRGNAVAFWGKWHMQSNEKAWHALTIVGYKPGKFLIADPYAQKSWGPSYREFWVSTSQFMNIYNSRGKKALVVR
ncbi:hypothetical protein EQG49_00545 [Periweissella cryptocerci]|uniref:Peptidase C39-like domain-containing protein n=1 Tax=Periweissella cryptocerci TaxID=2506420 RepID=A0A4P6YR27_9LACO|nr:C39 family peptidase [Periweissella cryptocerci]QBO35043.1 hypothetical protein EQG49_00545 [Periweissella cryptocerci]